MVTPGFELSPRRRFNIHKCMVGAGVATVSGDARVRTQHHPTDRCGCHWATGAGSAPGRSAIDSMRSALRRRGFGAVATFFGGHVITMRSIDLSSCFAVA